MDYINKQFKIKFEPVADPASIVMHENVRFTVLTSRIIRMEYCPERVFEDRASQVFWYRNQPLPDFNVTHDDNEIRIKTDYILLKYRKRANGFKKDTLSIQLKCNNVVWHYGDKDTANLLGTARTLDQVSGSTILEPGLMSADGWSVVDDSSTLVFNEDCWLVNRCSGKLHSDKCIDLYFYGYGNDYKSCLKDYCKIAGKVPLLPRWALGNWWSRYWEYTEDDLKSLMEEFQKNEVPLSVCIMDMDWHIVKNPYHEGWTGYTWNKDLFSDPGQFINWLHDKGLKTALNLHPAMGVYPHEEQYNEIAQFMGINPETKTPVEFNIGDSKFAKAYFEILHHPMEEQGIDFWWMDWQQGNKTKVDGLDPLWILNHLHFYDLGRDGSKRNFTFSRWGGLGNHRYPIGFSGDTIVNWESLAFQPYFTSTASNVGYTWWSHDIGGHMGGTEDNELYARWVQFGVFSPIMRLHSSKNVFMERRPWARGEETFKVTKDAMQLRHALIPYLYTMSWRNYFDSEPLIKPMYYEHPDVYEAYNTPNQYWYGSELIAAPFIQPADSFTHLSRQVVWLPEGIWFNFFTGESYIGGKIYAIYGNLSEIPVFSKAGAIVPLGPKSGWGGIGNPYEMEILIFPGADNIFQLYEDDGDSMEFEKGNYCLTKFEQKYDSDNLTFVIYPSEGNIKLIPQNRALKLVFRGIVRPDSISVKINKNPVSHPFTYDTSSDTLHIEELYITPFDCVEVILSASADSLISFRCRIKDKFKDILKNFVLTTESKTFIFNMLDQFRKDPGLLMKLPVQITPSQKQALFETFLECEYSEIVDAT